MSVRPPPASPPPDFSVPRFRSAPALRPQLVGGVKQPGYWARVYPTPGRPYSVVLIVRQWRSGRREYTVYGSDGLSVLAKVEVPA